MLELILCSMLTLFPDFLIRRFVQGKRLGKEITLFSVWYELRWGITLCLILTVLLITVVLYHHPSSTNVTSLFRTISLFPEVGGRVTKVYVDYNQQVKKGDPLFKMDSTRQEATLERARLQVVEVEAGMVTARADILTSEGKLQEAKGPWQQAQDELRTRSHCCSSAMRISLRRARSRSFRPWWQHGRARSTRRRRPRRPQKPGSRLSCRRRRQVRKQRLPKPRSSWTR